MTLIDANFTAFFSRRWASPSELIVNVPSRSAGATALPRSRSKTFELAPIVVAFSMVSVLALTSTVLELLSGAVIAPVASMVRLLFVWIPSPACAKLRRTLLRK